MMSHSPWHPSIPCGCVVICHGDAGLRRSESPDVVFLYPPDDGCLACISFFSLFVPLIALAAFRLPDDREPVPVEPILPRCYSIAGPGTFSDSWERPAPVWCYNCGGQTPFYDLPFSILQSRHAYTRQRAEFYQITAVRQCFSGLTSVAGRARA